MNGKYLLDTNAVIALLAGHQDLVKLLKDATWVGIPIIVELEFLSFSYELLFSNFKKRVEVVNLDASDTTLMQEIIQIRRNFNLKLPDSIVAGTAIQQQSILLSNDAIFQRVHRLNRQIF